MWKIKNRIRFGRAVSTLCVIVGNGSSVLGAGGDGWVFNFIGRDGEVDFPAARRDGRPGAAEFKIVESKANGEGGTIDCIVPR